MGNQLSNDNKNNYSAYAIGGLPNAPKHAHYPLHHMGCVALPSHNHNFVLMNPPCFMVRRTLNNENDVRGAIDEELRRVASAAGALYGPVFALVMRNLDNPRGSRPFQSAIDMILYFPGISKSRQRIIAYDALGRTHRWFLRLILSAQHTFTSGDADKWCSAKCLYNPRGSDPGNPKIPIFGTVRASAQFKRFYMTDFSYFAFLGIVPKINIGDYYPEDYFPCGTRGGGKTLRVAEFSPKREYFYALHQINPGGVSGVSWVDQRAFFNILPQNFPMYAGARWAMRSTNLQWVCVLEHRRLVIYGNAGNFFQRTQKLEKEKYRHVASENCNRNSNYCYAAAMMMESQFNSESNRSYRTKWQVGASDFMNQLILEPGLLQLTAENPTSNEIVVWKVRFSTEGFVQPFALLLTDAGDLVIYDGNNKEAYNVFRPRLTGTSTSTSTAPVSPPILRSSAVRRSDLAVSSLSTSTSQEFEEDSRTTTGAAASSQVDPASSSEDAKKCPPPPFRVV